MYRQHSLRPKDIHHGTCLCVSSLLLFFLLLIGRICKQERSFFFSGGLCASGVRVSFLLFFTSIEVMASLLVFVVRLDFLCES